MKNDMPKVKNIVIDEFVIDNPNEKQPFMIKGVELKYKKNKEGKGFYELSLDDFKDLPPIHRRFVEEADE